MTSLLERLSRYLPLILLIMATAALLQVALQLGHLFSLEGLQAWFHRNSVAIYWTLGAAGAFAWAFALLAYLRHRDSLPSWLTRRKALMDILDRLTNRQELERRISKEVDAVFIDANALADTLKSRVVGQDRVCDELAAQIRRRLALELRGRPIGVFLFAGPPGSGKTYLGKVLAQAVGRKLLHFDMTQFSGGFAASSLFGAAKGYVGSTTYGKLTAGLRDTPDAVVILDEFEKAHPDIHKNFLTAWNDGFITEASDGRQISTTRSLFVMTTNAAVDALADLSRQYANDPDELRRGADTALRSAGFAPEVLNRIDRIFVFEPLTGLDVPRVAALEIESMIQGYGLEISVGGINPQILLDLVRRQQKLGQAASARDLVRGIEETIADSLIEAKRRGAQRVTALTFSAALLAASSPSGRFQSKRNLFQSDRILARKRRSRSRHHHEAQRGGTGSSPRGPCGPDRVESFRPRAFRSRNPQTTKSQFADGKDLAGYTHLLQRWPSRDRDVVEGSVRAARLQ